jgi:hypothetical protein
MIYGRTCFFSSCPVGDEEDIITLSKMNGKFVQLAVFCNGGDEGTVSDGNIVDGELQRSWITVWGSALIARQ